MSVLDTKPSYPLEASATRSVGPAHGGLPSATSETFGKEEELADAIFRRSVEVLERFLDEQ
jgi:hypothetical protein